MASELVIGGVGVKKGERKIISLDIARLYDFTEVKVPVEVVRGKKDGPVLFVSAAIHGDEINGVEITRRLLNQKALHKIKGTLIAIPIVNVFGFNNKSRYLPDRRDLNRCFPGSEKGSLAAKLAKKFMDEIVSKSTHGIDLHTGAIHRTNLPQIRACLDDVETKRLSESFNVPVMINSDLRDGSLREAAREMNIPMILFEGGEALHFDEHVIKCGVQGILSVMKNIGMLPEHKRAHPQREIFIARSSNWVRAPQSGILNVKCKLGERVRKGEILGVVSDPFGIHKTEILATSTGIVIGMVTLPLLNMGDAVFHIATFENSAVVEDNVDTFSEQIGFA